MKPQCAYAPCGRNATSRGYCGAHYAQIRSGKDLAPLQIKKRSQWRGREKLCPRCDEFKDMDMFGRDRGRKDGKALTCKACAAEYRARNRDAILASWLKRFYNLTLEQYRALEAEQGGVCAICKKLPRDRRRLAVDHDHSCCPGGLSCGRCVRGLLCRPCNSVLGYVNDDPNVLAEGIVYLAKYSTQPT